MINVEIMWILISEQKVTPTGIRQYFYPFWVSPVYSSQIKHKVPIVKLWQAINQMPMWIQGPCSLPSATFKLIYNSRQSNPVEITILSTASPFSWTCSCWDDKHFPVCSESVQARTANSSGRMIPLKAGAS